MRKLLAILASASFLVFLGCSSDGSSSGARSPWSAASSPKPVAAAPAEEPAPAVVPAPDGEQATGDDFRLGEHLRAAVEAEGAAMIAAAAATEVIPPPREGKLLVMSVDPKLSLVEFKAVEKFDKGERVTFYKNMKPGVLKVVEEPKEGVYQPTGEHAAESKPVKFYVYTAEEVIGVVNSPEIEVEDELVCVPYTDPNVISKKKDKVVRCPHCGQVIANAGTDASSAVEDEDEDEEEEEEEEEEEDED